MDLSPVYHLSLADRWINDPCGLIHLDGLWHAYLQTNPRGVNWGNMSWGHATSTDLVRWHDRGIALECTEQLDIFTGTTLLDEDNLTGFGTADHPPLLAYWTGHHRPASPEAPREDQRVAFSLDQGATFTVPQSVNPVLTRHSTDFRDPHVFAWEGSFVMVAVEANDRQVLIYRSTDLLTWHHASTLGPLPTPSGIWECPTLVPLMTGEQRVWLLTFSAFGDDTQLPGTWYWLGDFDGTTFTPRTSARPVDHGPDLYAATLFARTPPITPPSDNDVVAPEAWRPDPPGRQIAMGWLSNPVYAGATPRLGAGGSGGRGCLSLPREYRLADDGGTLTQRVPDEVRARLGPARPVTAEHTGTGEVDLVDPIGLVAVTCLDPVVEIEMAGIRLRRDHAAVTLERFGSAGLGDRFPVATTISVDASTSEPRIEAAGELTLELWVDRVSLEVFTPDGQAWSALRFPVEATPWRTQGRLQMSYQPIVADASAG